MKKIFYLLSAVLMITGCRQPAPGHQSSNSDQPLPDSVLPSWNEGKTRTAILEFVDAVTDSNDVNYVKPEDRIAVFDNDGTLWSEQPMYFQGLFAFDRIRSLAAQHPEWKTKQPYKAVLENDMKTLAEAGIMGIGQIVGASHAGMTSAEFKQIVLNWIDTARHPIKKVKYTELTYKPMKELILYLQQNGFKTFIVSGGGVDFMRPWAERAYNIPSENIVGTYANLKFEMVNDTPALRRESDGLFVDDGPGKPVGIQRFIGKQPIAAFGNSDGDLQMLQYSTIGKGIRFGLIVHHTDAEREWAYDRASHIGKLDKALDEAAKRNWTIVDMKKDWNTIY
ncbi:HAD family hydrolase [Chitinophaga barathri]|uniref:phosphoserine phosphatase n=1 Tax=Chitinophaga barathri TaxID=1647451 RepID=A0A3N4M729_9BACT|nr:HAD family hydrolase [Chitinophaga barathri]RPD39018.1 haloacid dehalogenase-like hydrolase [Chitinophaga barathri]